LVSNSIAVESDSINVETDVEVEFNGIAVERELLNVEVELQFDNNIAVLGDNAAVVELVLVTLDVNLIAVDITAVSVVNPLTLANIKSEVIIDSVSVD
jgi:hypothetical protein